MFDWAKVTGTWDYGFMAQTGIRRGRIRSLKPPVDVPVTLGEKAVKP